MKSYCLKCRKDTEIINQKISKTSNNRISILEVKNQDLLKIKKQKEY